MQAADLLRHLVSVLEELDLPYALAGSIASMAYGEPRATLDIDVVVRLEPTDVDRLKAHFPSDEFYLDVEAAREAIAEGAQFNIIHPSSGLKIDVFVEGDEIERVQIEDRRRMPALPGFTARQCNPLRKDSLSGVISWLEEPRLASEKPVRIKFILRKAKLYAFWLGR